ncbi:NAD/NADP-dependent octopine/nopaline dehydrogenase family protein [Halobacillus yeomjeoni]|uniref:NAD/NADP octopine/nopaline dehydrogenase family protein n=1 Tax=Halobacillus yeomjeoni TaxID=311194 RepID=A0A931HXW1_9BACI|nr:NAD/NADP-dependent octopine/nopaline dehydrogenase family protein [Halobacillus yeomjeoni]MBH0231528.1 NAD/NADP octopine/nopaline dehydrogenase family protein [Halobacillus yeomjeoni]
MKIAVLGSGNGGSALAADWALSNHDVFMFDFEQFPDNIEAIRKNGGIRVEGEIEGFAKIEYAGFDIQHVVKQADLVFVVGPAYSTEKFAEACKPYLEKGQHIIVCPSACAGALVFKKSLGLSLKEQSYIISETSTLPYACRIIEPGHVKVFLKLKGGLYIAAQPSTYTQETLSLVKGVYPHIMAAKNVLQTTLQNSNPVIHPAVTLLNTALIERTDGNFMFYEEGVTGGVGNLMKAVDDEKIKVAEKLGVEVRPDPVIGVEQGYMTEDSYDHGYITAPGYKGIKAQPSLDHRYLNEDVGYTLNLIVDLAEHYEIDIPVIQAIIRIASVVTGKDFVHERRRTMESLGLEGTTLQKINESL